MSKTILQSDNPKLTFSLRALLLLVTFTGVAIGLALAIGPMILITIPIAPIAFVGFVAHKTGKPIPFWQCVGAIAILFALLPPLGYRINEFDAVVGAILFATAMWLIYRTLSNGQYLTKLLAIIVAIPYIYGLSMLTIDSVRRYEQIIEFWRN